MPLRFNIFMKVVFFCERCILVLLRIRQVILIIKGLIVTITFKLKQRNVNNRRKKCCLTRFLYFGTKATMIVFIVMHA